MMRKKDTRRRRPIAGTTIALIVWLLLFWDVNGWVSWPVAITLTTIVVMIPAGLYQLWLWTPETMRRTNRYRMETHRREQNRLTLKEAEPFLLKVPGLPLASLELDTSKRQTKMIGIPAAQGENHTIVIAPTRGGKGMHLTQLALQCDSGMVIVDPKGEIWERTAGYRQAHVGPVYRFPGCTLNLADYYDLTDRNDIEELALHLLKSWQDKQPIFAQKCKHLFLAAGLYAQQHNLNPVTVLFDLAECAPVHGLTALETAAPDVVQNFTNGSAPNKLDRFAQSAWGTFSTRLFPYQQHLHTLTNQTGFGTLPLDWAARHGTIYITYPLEILHGVGAALAAMIAALLRYQMKQKRQDQIIFAIDELPAVGLANVNQYLATVGGSKISLVLYAQAYAQLIKLYGRDGANAIMTNCRNQVWYPPADMETAKMMSALYGTKLQASQAFSTGSRDKRLVPDLGTQERGRSTHLQIHPTLSPEAMLALSADEVILQLEARAVLKAYRLWPVDRFATLPPPPYELSGNRPERRPPHWNIR